MQLMVRTVRKERDCVFAVIRFVCAGQQCCGDRQVSAGLHAAILRCQLIEFMQQPVPFVLEIEKVMHDGRLYGMGRQTLFSFGYGLLQFREPLCQCLQALLGHGKFL